MELPAYRALAAELRDAIMSGSVPPNGRLPTEVELAAERDVSRQTVRQAYAQLVAESLVYRVRGRGSFVTGSTRTGRYLRSFGSIDDLMALSVDTDLEVITPIERRADASAAGRLHLASDQVMVATFHRLHENTVFCVNTTYLPADLGQQLGGVKFLTKVGARSRETIIGLLERHASVSIAGAHQSVTAVPAPQAVAPHLDCEVGEAVLRIDRVYFDQRGENVELAINHFNPRRYSYRLELRRSPQ